MEIYNRRNWKRYGGVVLFSGLALVCLLLLFLHGYTAGREARELSRRHRRVESQTGKAGKNAGKAGEEEAPKIALTFDDGPSAACTGRLLDGLKERGIKATFFVIGQCAEKNPGLIKRMDQEGHLIGNHTYHHVEITGLSAEEALYEITKTEQIVFSLTGKHVKYVRPPFGSWKQGLEFQTEMLPVLWSVDPRDWTTENVDEIVNRVVTDAEENDIILLHDCYDSSVDAAFRIMDLLTARGYEFVTVEELLMD